MRINKYRGIRSYDKKWIYGSLLIDNNGDFHILESNIIEKDGHHIYIDSDSPMFFDNDTIGQFTGLFDKQGVEIYEGDIVKCVSELFSNFGKYPTGEYATEYYEICSRNGDRPYCFGTRKLNRDYVSKDILKSVAEKYYEVIGNIYENPELMKGDEL